MTAVAHQPGLAAPQRLTPEDMLRLQDDDRLYELVDGQLVEKRMSDIAQFVANRLKMLMDAWCEHSKAGMSFVETTYQGFPRPDDVRRPDVSFISAARLAGYDWGHGHFRLAPDLAVEVLSPHDEALEVDRKIGEYFQAGVRQVWIINPEQQIVRIHRRPGDLSELVGDVELHDELVLPGFRCRLPELFARPRMP